MAHNYNDNGTIYEIGGGKGNMNGTVYEIDHGKVNDNGTVYGVSFGPSVVNVAITNTGSSSYAYVTINNTKYSKKTTLQVDAGTEVLINAQSWGMPSVGVFINGVRKASGYVRIKALSDVTVSFSRGPDLDDGTPSYKASVTVSDYELVKTG